jgi:2'-5' RNA ligase
VSNRPHITVAVRDRLAPDAFGELRGIALSLPLPVELSGLLIFGGAARSVLARHVVASSSLLELHRRVAAIVGPPEARYSNTAPDRWSPHMTLARGLDAEQLARALRAIDAPPTGGEVTGIRVWDSVAKEVTTLR